MTDGVCLAAAAAVCAAGAAHTAAPAAAAAACMAAAPAVAAERCHQLVALLDTQLKQETHSHRTSWGPDWEPLWIVQYQQQCEYPA